MYRSCTPAESHWYRHMVTRVFVPDHASRQRRTGQRGGPGVTTPSVDYCLAKVTFGFWPTLHVALTGEVDMAPTICVVPLNVPLKTRVHCAAATCGDKVIATVDPVTVPDNWPPLMLLFGTPIVTPETQVPLIVAPLWDRDTVRTSPWPASPQQTELLTHVPATFWFEGLVELLHEN